MQYLPLFPFSDSLQVPHLYVPFPTSLFKNNPLSSVSAAHMGRVWGHPLEHHRKPTSGHTKKNGTHPDPTSIHSSCPTPLLTSIHPPHALPKALQISLLFLLLCPFTQVFPQDKLLPLQPFLLPWVPYAFSGKPPSPPTRVCRTPSSAPRFPVFLFR